jgi:hypothetical protein
MDGGVTRLPRLVDWAKVCMELRRHGFGSARVAAELNVSQSSAYRWFQGSEPSYSEGARLLHLYAVHVLKVEPADASLILQVTSKRDSVSPMVRAALSSRAQCPKPATEKSEATA